MLDLKIQSPINCSDLELERFKALLRRRSGIDPLSIDRRIQKAHKLAFAYVDSVLVGIGAIKHATPGFRRRILRELDKQFHLELPEKELGWFYVKEEFRGKGIGSRLFSSMNKALHNSEAFSLTYPDNGTMRKLLTSGGYSNFGKVALENRPIYLLFTNNAIAIESN